MAEGNKTHAEHLIRLQLSQDEASQTWTRFMFVVEGGLGTGYGLIVLGDKLTGIRAVLAILLALVGIVTAVTFRKIIRRHHQWSAWFINKYTLLKGNLGVVFPSRPLSATTIDEVDPGDISEITSRFCDLAVLFWLFLSIFALVVWGSG